MASSALHIDALPRTLELVQAGDKHAELVFVDQRKLPDDLVYVHTRKWTEVVEGVRTLALRGAPALGAAGAAALALWVCEAAEAHEASDEVGEAHEASGAGGEADRAIETDASREACEVATSRSTFDLQEFARVADVIASARPTAVNLSWGVQQVVDALHPLIASGASVRELAQAAVTRVKEIEAADEAANRTLGAYGAALLPHGARVLTHCNAGSLATVFYGTALGVIYAAAEQGKIERVYADETRPVRQGARLSAWELARAGVPCTLICDNMAASLMTRGEIDAVIVGADRIAANGDTANKIGTYGLAVFAHHHAIPFYVAAPTSTIDACTATGADIPIEQRDAKEVLPKPIADVDVYNPAFDVTPATLITAIITEQGIAAPPYSFV